MCIRDRSVIDSDVTDFYSYSINEKEEKLEIGYKEIISGILRDLKDGKTASYISAKFHNTVCEDVYKRQRYMYPFTSCTSCGPGYSIIKTLPYDRLNTSMSVFKMCPACRSEYESPDNRRFHVQTNCCPDCGPKLVLLDRKGRSIDSIHPVATAGQLLYEGRLIAIKGIGGYHIACNACEDVYKRQVIKC